MKTINQKTTQLSIGAELALMRREKGFDTVKAFAKRYRLPAIQYWRMEKGKSNITLKSLIRVLNIHKVPVSIFFMRIL